MLVSTCFSLIAGLVQSPVEKTEESGSFVTTDWMCLVQTSAWWWIFPQPFCSTAHSDNSAGTWGNGSICGSTGVTQSKPLAVHSNASTALALSLSMWGLFLQLQFHTKSILQNGSFGVWRSCSGRMSNELQLYALQVNVIYRWWSPWSQEAIRSGFTFRTNFFNAYLPEKDFVHLKTNCGLLQRVFIEMFLALLCL